MFGFNGNGKKNSNGNDEVLNIFDASSVEEFIEALKKRFNKTLEQEIKDQLKKFKIDYKRDEHVAINTGITAKWEEKSKEYICPRMPNWVSSDMLTALGFIANFIVASGFILGFFNRYYLVLIIIGFILSWLGDSFDGSLARYRKKTRPNYGYYIDHVIDGVAVFVFGLGLGLSGFVRIEIGLIFAIAYLILIVHVELINYVQNEFKYSFGLFGPTEFRLIGMIVAVVMFFVPVKYFDIWGYNLTQYDLVAGIIVIIMFLIILFSIISKGIELNKLDTKDWPKKEK